MLKFVKLCRSTGVVSLLDANKQAELRGGAWGSVG